MKTCTCGTVRFADLSTGALQHCPYHDEPHRGVSMVWSVLTAVALLYLALALTGCTTLGGTIDRETRSVTWRCDGRVNVRMQTGGVRVECPAGPMPLVVVEGQVEQ